MKKILSLLFISLFLVSCTTNQAVNETVNNVENEINHVTNEPVSNETETTELETAETEEVEIVEETEEEAEVVEEIDYEALYRAYKVNEVGKTIVIMYHNLSDKPGAYASTPELFRADLERLYEEGYRTVSMSDLVNNTIDIPMGTTPVVLTFDDGSKSNFYYDENGEIAEDCVVGILESFAAEHEDFGTNAIFYLYSTNPFREQDLIQQKLNYLVDNGYEIGNHTFGHENLTQISATAIEKTLAQNEAFIASMVEGYHMVHLSLPYGQRPKDDRIEAVWSGSYEGTNYDIVSAVNVGWNPIVSPAHKDFNPKSINRITCGDDNVELNYWLDDLKRNPSKKYISDGDPNTVVVPETLKDKVKDIYLEQLITYEESEEE